MASAKTFLLQLPFSSREPNLALAQLYAYLRRHGKDVEVMDVSIRLLRRDPADLSLLAEETSNLWSSVPYSTGRMEAWRAFLESEVVAPIAKAERPVVGFAVSGCSLQPSLILAKWLKAARPDAVVVFGGQLISMFQHQQSVLRSGVVDALVSGDGEETLLELVRRVEDGRALSDCAGLFLPLPHGQMRYTGDRPLLNLDDLPFADFGPFDLGLYESIRLKGHDIPMMASRGCVRRCAFCGHRTAWKGFRFMSGDRMFAEMRHQKDFMESRGHTGSKVKFYDLLVNGEMAKLERLCDLLIADGRPIEWDECNAIIRPEMTYDFCRKLYAAGCRTLIVGLESGSQKILDSMDKGQTVAQMKAVLENIDRAGLKARGNFMFGFPGETEEDFQKTLRFLEDAGRLIHTVYPSFTFTHLEGRLHEDPSLWGVAPGQHDDYWESKDGANTYPVRLDRFRRFVERAQALGLNLGIALDMPLEAYMDWKLAKFHSEQGRASQALSHYRRYLDKDPGNEYVLGEVARLSAARS